MPWIYVQSTGNFYDPEGKLLEKGYSGRHDKDGAGKFLYRDNPDAEAESFKGPIPRGMWKIGGYTSTVGPLTITLTPVGHNAHGRTDFRIHGDNSTRTASEGCIILGRTTRQTVVNSKNKELKVVGYPDELIKPWVYIQRSGTLYTPDGHKAADGVSGDFRRKGLGSLLTRLNIQQGELIPCGLWEMSPSSYARGAFTIGLKPVRHNGRGRSNLCIHGNNPGSREADRYSGIMLPEDARRRLAGSSVRYLKVVQNYYGLE